MRFLVFYRILLGSYLQFCRLLSPNRNWALFGPTIEIIRTFSYYALLLSFLEITTGECAGNDPTPDVGEATSSQPPQERLGPIKVPRNLHGEAFDTYLRTHLTSSIVDHWGWYLTKYRPEIMVEFPNATNLDSLSFLSRATTSLCEDYGLEKIRGAVNLRKIEETIFDDISMSREIYIMIHLPYYVEICGR